MSVDTYSALQAEVASWLRRSDLAAEIPTFITLAEAQMNRKVRCRQMLARVTEPITGQLTAAPADLVAPRSARLTGTSCLPTRLKWVSQEQMDALLDGPDFTSGPPRHYTLEGSNFRFSPDPGTGAYTLELSYYARIPALSNSNSSNWLLAAHPDAYLYGALTQSAPYMRADERLQVWAQIFGSIVESINASDSGQGGALEMMPSQYGM